VLTGGGALMKHIQQLASFKTGLDVRIGYPNEHLSEDSIKELASPMYATGIGLVIEGIARAEYQEKMERAKHKEPIVVIPHKPVEEEEIVEEQPEEPTRRSRRQKKEGEKKHRFDLTKIITVFLSEENEIKE
jgi:cell division protein FtsA